MVCDSRKLNTDIKVVQNDANDCDILTPIAANGNVIQTACCISKFLEVQCDLKDKMKDEHRAEIQKTCFGHFLDMPNSTLHKACIKACIQPLLERWDCEKKGFKIGGSIVPFTVNDTAMIYGLNVYGERVHFGKRKWSRSKIMEGHFNGLSILKSDDIVKRLHFLVAETSEQSVQDFTRLYILYLFATVLFPLSTKCVPVQLISYVDDLDRLKKLSWATAVHSFLEKSMHNVLEKARRNERTTIWLIGSAVAIEVWLYEHSTIWKAPRPEQIPRIFKWEGIQWAHLPYKDLIGKLKNNEVILVLNPNEEEKKYFCPFSTIPKNLEAIDTGDELRYNSVITGTTHCSNSECLQMKGKLASELRMSAGLPDINVKMSAENDFLKDQLKQPENLDEVVGKSYTSICTATSKSMTRRPKNKRERLHTHEEDPKLDSTDKNERALLKISIDNLLSPDGWVSSMVINVYAELLRLRAKKRTRSYIKCLYFEALFDSYINGTGTWMKDKGEEIFAKHVKSLRSYNKIFIPINHGSMNHWCLCVVDVRERKFLHYNSLSHYKYMSYVKDTVAYMKEKLARCSGWESVEEWPLENRESPHQSNGNDCGVFMLLFMECLSRGDIITIDGEIASMRRRLADQIIHKSNKE